MSFYEVHWSVIGHEPDSKPFIFDDWVHAAEFFLSELFWSARDHDLSKDENVALAEFKVNVNNIIMATHGELPKTNLQYTIANISYWLIERDGSIKLPEF